MASCLKEMAGQSVEIGREVENVYKPGELIYCGLPFAHVVYYDDRERYCDNCIKRSDSALKKCTGCRYVYYCNEKCQRRAWVHGAHKAECPFLPRLEENRQDFVRLIGKVILLLKGKEWSSCQENVGNFQRSFEDLISHCDVTKNDPKLSLHGLEVLHLLKHYLGENLPDDDRVLEIIGKVRYNRFGVNGVGSALYIGGSVFEHSCIPNANRVFEGSVMKIRSITDIPKNDIKKVTISYTPMLDALNHFEETKKTFFSECKCVDCSLPYGDSILTKILDKTKAWSVIESSESALEQLGKSFEKRATMSKENLLVIKELLRKQENVLDDTNLLRMRLLAFKIFYEQVFEERIHDLEKLTRIAEKVFGEYSEELVWMYDMLTLICRAVGNVSASRHYHEKLQDLKTLLYKDPNVSLSEGAPVAPPLETMISMLRGF